MRTIADRRTVLTAFAFALGLATPAVAEPAESTYGQSSPEAARAALNREQADKARQQVADNEASLRASQDAAIAREDQIKRDKLAWQQEADRLAADHEAAMDQWRADVAACRSGDRARCKH